MKKHNFDQIIDRSGTNALKTDALTERFGREDIIPLWVADMDFASPPEIIEAIIKRAQHGVFGYTQASQEYYNAIIGWLHNQHSWDVKKEWISYIPGIVKGISFVINCFTTKDDKIVIQPPVYYPFRTIPELNHRTVVNNPLILENGQYRMDFDDLIKKIDKSCKIFILCNPHNPGGRVWTKEELIKLADICYDNDILVISDEIHSDLVYEGHEHIPFASVSEKAAQISITFMAPSKTFNIAGLVSSFSVIINSDIRNRFDTYLNARELNSGDIFSYLATQTAYEKGAVWLKEAKEYLWKNIVYVDEYLRKNIHQIKVIVPEASYLIWLDCRQLNMSQDELVSFFIHDAKLALNNGIVFGKEGEGFMRMNIGTPLTVVKKALENLNEAIKNKH